MKREELINILIGVLIFIIIIFIIILMLNQMGEKFDRDCSKQNYYGIKSYWGIDIDCSQVYQIPQHTIMNETLKSYEELF